MPHIERVTEKAVVDRGFELWNREHPAFHIGDRFIDQHVYAPHDFVSVSAWGVSDEGGELIGFLLAKRLRNEIPSYAGPETGWISLLAVAGDRSDSEEIGVELLTTAEDSLAGPGVETITFGKDIQNFLAGLPKSLQTQYDPILSAAGYEQGASVYDVTRDISTFERPDRVADTLASVDVRVRRLEPEDTDTLLGFLADQFPGRWHYSAELASRLPGGIQQYWGVWEGDSLVGFAGTRRCDAAVVGSNLIWGPQLADRYCALGPIGVHENARGNGYGLAMMAHVIETFRDEGYTQMIIDWTTIIDYYAKFGFEPFVEYIDYTKTL